MVFSKLFGETCVRCGEHRTRKEVEGLPTCDQCESKLEASKEEKRPCLVCAIPMEKTTVQNVLIDRCPTCQGVWLDGGELELLQKAMQSGGDGDFASGFVLGMVIG